MVYIESAEAKKELGRIDDILNEKHRSDLNLFHSLKIVSKC